MRLAFPLKYFHFEGMGFYRILHLLAKSIGFAKDDFIKYSSTNFTMLKGRFRDNATLEVKDASYPIVAVYKEGLIVRDNSHLKSVSKLDSANLYPLSAVVEIEEPMRAISSRITLDGESIGELIQHVDPEIEHYILGEAIPASKPPRIPEESDAYSPLYMSGDRIKFNYATIDDLKPFSSQVLKLGDVIVQYRLRPYEDPPSLNGTPIVGVVETPLMISVRDLDSIKVKVGDEIEKGSIIAQDIAIQSELDRKEAELQWLEAVWVAERVRIETRKGELRSRLALIPSNEDLEKLKNIFSARELERRKYERINLSQGLALLEEQLRAEEKAHVAKGKKLEVEISQLKEKMSIESPVSGKVASIRLINITGDKSNIEILILTKNPFPNSSFPPLRGKVRMGGHPNLSGEPNNTPSTLLREKPNNTPFPPLQGNSNNPFHPLWGKDRMGGSIRNISEKCKVTNVVDGDTFSCKFGWTRTETIRLIGVDTPETKHPKKPVEFYGREASNFTKKML